MIIEMFVRLIIPDTTAITAEKTLNRMGYNVKVHREDYYRINVDEDNFDKISNKLGKVDILVNANKHKYFTKPEDEKLESKKKNGVFFINLIVKDIDNPGKRLLPVLKQRLGFKEINYIEKGVFWRLGINADSKKEAVEKAKEIADCLLFNENYQVGMVLG